MFLCKKTVKNVEGSNKTSNKYLIPRTIVSKNLHEILNLNSRTENKWFLIIILFRILLNGGTKSDFLLSGT